MEGTWRLFGLVEKFKTIIPFMTGNLNFNLTSKENLRVLHAKPWECVSKLLCAIFCKFQISNKLSFKLGRLKTYTKNLLDARAHWNSCRTLNVCRFYSLILLLLVFHLLIASQNADFFFVFSWRNLRLTYRVKNYLFNNNSLLKHGELLEFEFQ